MSIETLFPSNIIVPIIVAFIGFLIAVTTAVIAKEQKVSEFRQAWIDSVREDFASLIVGFHSCRALSVNLKINHLNNNPFSEILSDYHHARLDSLLKMQLIKFRLNVVEHKVIIIKINAISDKMEDILNIQSSQNNINNLAKTKVLNSELISSIDELSNMIPTMLKKEWEVVKKGEKHFVNFRDLGELCLFAFIAAFFFLFYLVKFPEYFPGIN